MNPLYASSMLRAKRVENKGLSPEEPHQERVLTYPSLRITSRSLDLPARENWSVSLSTRVWSVQRKFPMRRESGQSAVLTSLLLIVITIIIAFTTNLGKLVTEKIAMQNAVDMAVYSGAAMQAGQLNELRD